MCRVVSDEFRVLGYQPSPFKKPAVPLQEALTHSRDTCVSRYRWAANAGILGPIAQEGLAWYLSALFEGDQRAKAVGNVAFIDYILTIKDRSREVLMQPYGLPGYRG